MISQPSRQCAVELQALPSRIGQVRRIVSAQLRYWRLDPLTDRAALGVTELLTNVHRHARPDKMCTVEMELLPGRLTVAVHDHDPRLPEVREAAPFETGGRGLAMIAAMCESWGAVPHGDSGKAVWFTLPVPTTQFTTALPAYGTAPAGPLTDLTDLTGLPRGPVTPLPDLGGPAQGVVTPLNTAPARSAVAG